MRITKELLEQSIEEHNQMEAMVCKNKYQLGEEKNLEEVLNRVTAPLEDGEDKALVLSKKFLPAGSILSGMGNEEYKCSLSNCYLTPILEDSIEGIFDCQKALARTFSYRGGSGVTLNILRPANCKVDNAAKTSTGAVSFMPSFAMTACIIGQQGRRAALLMGLDIRHPDTPLFIRSKSEPAEVFGVDQYTGATQTISEANISLMVPDSFMEAVEEDATWQFIFPDIDAVGKEFYNEHWDGDFDKWEKKKLPFKKYGEPVSAKQLLEDIAEAAHKIGDPGILFMDTAQKWTLGTYIDESLKPVGSNPCQPSWATVLTPKGISTIGKIKIGDIIWSEDGWVRVINKEGNGQKDVHKYSTTAGVFVGTKEHRVKSDGIKIAVDKAESIDILNCYEDRVPTYNPQVIMDGLLIGDGAVHKASGNLILLCVGKNDADYFESEIADLLVKNRPGIFSGEYDWEVATTLVPEDIPLTYNRKVPDKYKFGTYNEVTSFLRGLFSANGCVLRKYKRITLKAASFQMIDDVQLMLSSVGIPSYYTVNKSKKVKFSNGEYTCKQSYDLNITIGRDKFRDKIGFLQHYKQEDLEFIINNISLYSRKPKSAYEVKGKEFVSTEEVYNITVSGKSHTYWSGGLNVANCGEQPLAPWNNCLLGAFVLTKYISNPFTEEAEFDYATFYSDVATAVGILNTYSDINESKHPLEEQQLTDKFGKRIGIEVTGLADTLAMLNIKYGTIESIAFVDHLFMHKAIQEIQQSVDMAVYQGAAPAIVTDKVITSMLTSPYLQNLLTCAPDSLTERIKKYGMANTALNTIGPCGSLSIISGNCTSGVEPLFKFAYTRKNRIDGKTYSFIHKPAAEYMLANLSEFEGLTLKQAKEKLNYVEADEVPLADRVKLQGTIQQFIDSAISSTVNLPNHATKDTIYEIYRQAHEHGLKGITVFRDGCKESVLNAVKKEQEPAVPNQPFTKDLLDIESAERHRVYWKGSKLYINVSLDEDGVPIEVFAKLPVEAGVNGNGAYNPTMWQERTSNWDLACRLLSMLLRMGAPLGIALKQLDRSTYSMVDAAGILKRVLQRYVKAEQEEDEEGNIGEECPECHELAYNFEGGCGICRACGYTKCG